jgi:hypothetical protein
MRFSLEQKAAKIRLDAAPSRTKMQGVVNAPVEFRPAARRTRKP